MKRWLLNVVLVAVVIAPCVVSARPKRPEPQERGSGYSPLRPPNGCKRVRMVWNTYCRAPEGKGLALDGLDQGVNQTKELPRPHTRILVDGKWKNIYPELCKNNPLQSHCDRAYELKVALCHARALTRHIWFKGLKPDAERERLNKEAVPAFNESLSAFETFIRVLEDRKDVPEYEQSQLDFALKHFKKARELLRTGEQIRKGVLQAQPIIDMQRAQVEIEIGADALDAEPPPRVLSTPAYDEKTGLYVLFGGDHFDYLMNDTWVFDPRKRKWFQRHPQGAPDPRGQHRIDASGDGTVRVSGGYMYDGGGYAHAGKAVWIYDIPANTWTTDSRMKPVSPDTRQYRDGSLHPRYFLAGLKPNAAEHEKKLASLPVNEWVPMEPPRKRAGNRAWGTVALDTDRDLIVDWNGGHSAWCSTTAPHYHLGVNRWELPYPEELPLGMIGASGDAVIGFSFNGRRWITNHTWAQYDYDRTLKKVVVVASMRKGYYYTYDPLLAEWTAYRMWGGHTGMTVWTRKGMLQLPFRPRKSYDILDYKTMKLKRIKTKGEFTRKAAADWFGIAYDSKRRRLVGMPRPGNGLYRKGPRANTIKVLDLNSNGVNTLTPTNIEALGAGCKYVRELRYIPDEDIFLICDGIREKTTVKGKTEWVPGRKMAAWDPADNRWLVLDIKNRPIGFRGRSMYGFSFGCRYDEKRKLLWGLDGYGHVCAMRLDVAKAVDK